MATLTSIVGTQQSPININTAETFYAPELKDALDISYRARTSVSGTFEDHNFIIDKALRPSLCFRGRTYRLVKLHFHVACEHQFDDRSPANFELHLLHQLEKAPASANMDAVLGEEKLVIAVFFNVTMSGRGTVQKNSGFSTLASQVNQNLAKSTDSTPSNQSCQCNNVDISDFIPGDASKWYCYEGSLTSPGFSEDVTWVLMPTPEPVNKDNYETLVKNHADQEQRGLQVLNRRFVLRNFEKGSNASAKPLKPRRRQA